MTKQKKVIDPWSEELPEDYTKVIEQFGMDKFNLKDYPKPNKIMRRQIVIAERGMKPVLKAMKKRKKFYVLTGFMPSSDKLHLGNKLVVDNVKYFQEQGADTYILVADLESAATRKTNYKETDKSAREYFIPTFLALGLNKNTKFYFQSKNTDVTKLAFQLSNKATTNEYKAIYGNADPPRVMSSVLQVADILYPQLKEEMPGVIPVGFDQDPHIRLTRDIARRQGNFFLPAGFYHKYTPALDGSMKMSKSKKNYIELPDTDENIEKQIKTAKTGGRKSQEEQKKKGGIPEHCMIFELYKQHLIESDTELNKIYKNCKSGKLLCGECKQKAMKEMKKFMNDFKKKFNQAKKIKPNIIE